MKREKTMKLISNILFGLGIALGVGALLKSFIESASLPPGVCPFDQNRWLTFTALGVLGAALIFSLITDFLKRRERKNQAR